jgi:hypothetical protein
MAKETITRCDGCDTDKGAFSAIRVDIGPASTRPDPEDRSTTFDLCVQCEAKMYNVTNPANWPRTKRKPRAPKVG